MLSELSVEKVCTIVMLARQFEVQAEEPIDDASNPTDDKFAVIFTDDNDSPVVTEMRELINAMNEDELNELVALCWTGRGDYGAAEWNNAVIEARARRRGSTANYLLGIPLLPDYLEEGLAQFNLSCEDFETSRR